MTRFALLLSSLLMLIPAMAHADCTTDLADAEGKARGHHFDIQANPRAKALWDKAAKAAKSHNDRDCKDALQGLNQQQGMTQ